MNDELLPKAIEDWSKQGRTEEQIFGVTNFFTGRGKKFLEDYTEQVKRQTLNEAFGSKKVEDMVCTLCNGALSWCPVCRPYGIFTYKE